MTSRRTLIKTILAAPLIGLNHSLLGAASKTSLTSETTTALPQILKSIPKTREKIASIGMGSSRTFDIDSNSPTLSSLNEVVHHFIKAGGQLIDSSPMYGNSETIIGKILEKNKLQDEIFAASKVWTYGKKQGMLAVKETQRRMRFKRMDLMQVHNLRDWNLHLPTLHELKAAGKLRYVGITTSFNSQYQDFEHVIKNAELDFIQVNYNIAVTEAAKRILPLAKDKGIAVIINRPFEKARLFSVVKNNKVPDWCSDFNCHTWGQFFLKYITSHPDVTCAIPATSKVKHMKDNMFAMRGRLPTMAEREKMKSFFDSI